MVALSKRAPRPLLLPGTWSSQRGRARIRAVAPSPTDVKNRGSEARALDYREPGRRGDGHREVRREAIVAYPFPTPRGRDHVSDERSRCRHRSSPPDPLEYSHAEQQCDGGGERVEQPGGGEGGERPGEHRFAPALVEQPPHPRADRYSGEHQRTGDGSHEYLVSAQLHHVERERGEQELKPGEGCEIRKRDEQEVARPEAILPQRATFAQDPGGSFTLSAFFRRRRASSARRPWRRPRDS